MHVHILNIESMKPNKKWRILRGAITPQPPPPNWHHWCALNMKQTSIVSNCTLLAYPEYAYESHPTPPGCCLGSKLFPLVRLLPTPLRFYPDPTLYILICDGFFLIDSTATFSILCLVTRKCISRWWVIPLRKKICSSQWESQWDCSQNEDLNKISMRSWARTSLRLKNLIKNLIKNQEPHQESRSWARPHWDSHWDSQWGFFSHWESQLENSRRKTIGRGYSGRYRSSKMY